MHSARTYMLLGLYLSHVSIFKWNCNYASIAVATVVLAEMFLPGLKAEIMMKSNDKEIMIKRVIRTFDQLI